MYPRTRVRSEKVKNAIAYRLPQVRLAVGCLGAHAITIAACGIERTRGLTTVGPAVMVRSWLAAEGKILLTIE
jgi:hypothetical protein